MEKKQKGKNKNFKLLSKKAFMGLAVASLMIASPVMLTGCGEKGDPGKDGAPGAPGKNGSAWYTGTQYDLSQGVVGDFFYDTDDGKIYRKNEGGWYLISTIKSSVSINSAGYWVIDGIQTNVKAKGENGTNGTNGTNGENGTDGLTPEIKNGYWWIGETNTEIPATGENGKSAFELSGFDGTVEEWIESLKGEKGDTGAEGPQGPQGNPGKDGSSWLTGAEITGKGSSISATIDNSKVGDLYFNITSCDIYICTAQNTWSWIVNIKGEQGNPGKDGTSVYIGYDGYVWNGSVRSELKVGDVVDNTTVTNTMGLVSHDAYFQKKEIDASTTQVALMDYYFENIQKVGYSGVSIADLSLFAAQAGTITIGTAKVIDVVENRKTGTTINFSNSQQFTLTQGLNNLEGVNLEVGADETIVFGNADTDTAKLLAYEGVSAYNDNQGNISTIVKNSALSEEPTIDTTNEANDKLLVKLTLNIVLEPVGDYGEETALIDTLNGYNKGGQEMGLNNVNGPFSFTNRSMFANTKLTSLSFKLIQDDVSITTFPIYVVKQDIWENENSRLAENYRTYNIALPTTRSVNSIITLDLTSYNIIVEEDETLAFASKDLNNFKIAYHFGASIQFNDDIQCNKLMLTTPTRYDDSGIILNLQVKGNRKVLIDKTFIFEEHLEKLKEESYRESVRKSLKGKNISILGDSISTCEGYSDNNEYNSTLGINQSRYYVTGNQGEATLQLNSVDETWWMQTINGLQANLLVNNSYRGKKVTDSSARAVQLHDDTTANNINNEVVNPDIIIIMLGTNDLSDTVSNIVSSYRTMIASMKQAYPNAELFVCSLLNYTANAKIAEINAAYKTMCLELGLGYIDFYNCGITPDNVATTLADSLHPSKAGFDMMSEVAIDAILEYYANK